MTELRKRLRDKVEAQRQALQRAIDAALMSGRESRHVRILRSELRQVEEWLSDGWDAVSDLTLARMSEWLAVPGQLAGQSFTAMELRPPPFTAPVQRRGPRSPTLKLPAMPGGRSRR